VGICEGVILFGVSPLASQLTELRNDEKWTNFVNTYLVSPLRGANLEDFLLLRYLRETSSL
jgi:hypothetical protein